MYLFNESSYNPTVLTFGKYYNQIFSTKSVWYCFNQIDKSYFIYVCHCLPPVLIIFAILMYI